MKRPAAKAKSGAAKRPAAKAAAAKGVIAPKAAMKRPAAKGKSAAIVEEPDLIPLGDHGFGWREGKTWAGARCPVRGSSHEVFVQKVIAYSSMCDWLYQEDPAEFRHSEKLAREFNDHVQAKKNDGHFSWNGLPKEDIEDFLSKAAVEFAVKKMASFAGAHSGIAAQERR